MGFSRECVCTSMFNLGNSLWVFFCQFILNLVLFIIKYLQRFLVNVHPQKKVDSVASDAVRCQEDDDNCQSGFFGRDYGSDGADNETEWFTLNTSKYQIVPQKDVCGFVEGGETVQFTVHEFLRSDRGFNAGDSKDENCRRVESEAEIGTLFSCLEASDGSLNDENFISKDFPEIPSEAENDDHGKAEASFIDEAARDLMEEVVPEAEVENQGNEGSPVVEFISGHDSDQMEEAGLETEEDKQEQKESPFKNSISIEDSDQVEEESSVDHEFLKNEEVAILEDDSLHINGISWESQVVHESNFLPSDSITEEADHSNDGSPIKSSTVKVDSGFFAFLSEDHFGEHVKEGGFLNDDEMGKVEETWSWKEENSEEDLGLEYGQIEASSDEYIELEPLSTPNITMEKATLLLNDLSRAEELNETELEKGEQIETEPRYGTSLWNSDTDSDDDNDDDDEDILWEHMELIEQMKMDRKLSRVKGLPTILEESETLKMAEEDLKPLEIKEQFEHKDQMEEIHKFYKSYAEKMRKLDILNYQTMHAISFLQLKDPIKLMEIQRNTNSAIKSLLMPSLWPCKLRRIYADPTLKSITEMYGDLEAVYVGQVCLSWEVLRWQYCKTRELLQHDREHPYSYSHAAAEVQQFQVLLQRFTEDEPFQEPRVQHYAKKRLILRTFLQVPVIKDDSWKDNNRRRIEVEEDTISIARLASILEESMQVFWEFLRADKNETNSIIRFPRIQSNVQADAELMMQIKSSLQRKERRLKERVRSGNCIVKKFQKQEGRSPLDYGTFVAQVELRLVSRVLNLSRLTTEQLLWCQKKLSNVTFANRKFHVEPSFLLFPLQKFSGCYPIDLSL